MSRSLKELSFPIQYIEIFESLISAAGGNSAELYQRCRISQPRALDLSARMDGEQLHAALTISRPYCKSGRSEASQYLDHFPLMHGQLGLLAMVSRTVEEAVYASVEFMPLVLPAFALRCDVVRDKVQLVFERQADFGEHNDLLTEVVIGSFGKIVPFMAKPFEEASICLQHRCSGDPASYQIISGVELPVCFESAQNMFTFERRALSIALVTQSRMLHAKFETTLSQQARAEHLFKPTSRRVKHIIEKLIDENRAFDRESIAQAVHVSLRTLSRRLQEEGTTLPQLQTEVRMFYARNLLLNSDKPVAEIAHRVGFTELSNFTRAFKRMFGEKPTEVRANELSPKLRLPRK